MRKRHKCAGLGYCISQLVFVSFLVTLCVRMLSPSTL